MFQFRLVNRAVYPQRHVLVCEDHIGQQARIAAKLFQLFGGEGNVQCSFVCGGLAAAAVMAAVRVDLVILDHDMPQGNGSDLIEWMKKLAPTIPVVTFSGLPGNNLHMVRLGAQHHFDKEAVITGAADALLRRLLA